MGNRSFGESPHGCLCGYYGDSKHDCTCSPLQVQRYMAKISGPLLDRIDLQIEVPSLSYKELADSSPSESSAIIQERVNCARAVQQQRFARTKIYCNAQMASRHLRSWCQVDEKSHALLERAIDKLGLSARTIADLDASDNIRAEHISEAVQYRSLDRQFRS